MIKIPLPSTAIRRGKTGSYLSDALVLVAFCFLTSLPLSLSHLHKEKRHAAAIAIDPKVPKRLEKKSVDSQHPIRQKERHSIHHTSTMACPLLLS
jgi:hypothetical protein